VKIKAPVAIGVILGSSFLCLVGYAQEHGEHGRPAPPAPVRPAPPRPAPPPFQAHPAGVHPHGAVVHQHPVRVLQPAPVMHGHTTWTHWEHPEFTRPVYYWNWGAVHNVTCVAEDSYGDQYPVSEPAAPGFALGNMTDVEDDALDRCYSESGQDQTCVLATCTHI
jgi:hypothetical protein